MSKTGRPPLPDDERKECTFRIRMTEEDREAISAAAEMKDKRASEWAREILLKAAARGGRVNRT